MNHIYFNTLSENLDRVTIALECLKSIENEYVFFGFSTRLKPVVEYIGNKYYANKKLHTVDTVWYAASKELVDTFNIQWVCTLYSITLNETNNFNLGFLRA